jgi:DNA-binding NarL/FixJ family response regulator
MHARIQVIVASEQTLLRDLLAAAIGNDSRFSVEASVSDVFSAAREGKKTGAGVLLLDLDQFPWEKVPSVQKALKRAGSPAVLGLTARSDPFSVQRSAEAGFSGVFEKDRPFTELTDALLVAGRGEKYFSDGVLQTRKEIIEDPRSFPKMLTRREQEIVALVGNYFTSREIAERCSLSVRTVETHRYNIMKKLQIRDAPGLIRYSVENGLEKLVEAEAVGQ